MRPSEERDLLLEPAARPQICRTEWKQTIIIPVAIVIASARTSSLVELVYAWMVKFRCSHSEGRMETGEVGCRFPTNRFMSSANWLRLFGYEWPTPR